jgi:hypothetical protein
LGKSSKSISSNGIQYGVLAVATCCDAIAVNRRVECTDGAKAFAWFDAQPTNKIDVNSFIYMVNDV